MRIALVDVDGHNFPNLALMKISGWHKAQGDHVEWYAPLFSNPDRIYASKVFTFKPDFLDYAPTHPVPIKGGTGYGIMANLPDEIENFQPDFSLYPDEVMRNHRSGRLQAFGFLTRGCIRQCPWCVVPQKEGTLKIVSDIEDVAQDRSEVVLMDNNFLGADIEFIREQLRKIAKLKIKIDFNQGLDARLMTVEIAELMVKCKWIRFIRFSCDSKQMIEPIREAVRMIRSTGSRREIACYMLVTDDLVDAEARLQILNNLGVTPFAQPYRDFSGNDKPRPELRKFAEFVNIKGANLSKTTAFKDYY